MKERREREREREERKRKGRSKTIFYIFKCKKGNITKNIHVCCNIITYS